MYTYFAFLHITFEESFYRGTIKNVRIFVLFKW